MKTSALALQIALTFAGFATVSNTASAVIFDNGIPAEWACKGNCGTAAANGVVTTPPNSSSYGWVSTNNGVNSVSPFSLGSEQTGSSLTSKSFSAMAGDKLDFFFNYVTSDGSEFADYGWSRLLNSTDNSQAALLFTARTKPSGNIVPGQDMPLPNATLDPFNVAITAGAPTWSPLGTDSGRCFGPGCGYTGWVKSSFIVQATGNYKLEFGVVNSLDTAFQTGMAFDGITIAGKPIDPVAPVPEPETYALMGIGLVGLIAARRRKK